MSNGDTNSDTNSSALCERKLGRAPNVNEGGTFTRPA